MAKGLVIGFLLLRLPFTAALLCLSCKHVVDVRDCLHVVECERNETCFSNRILDVHGVLVYHLGCTNQHKCDLIPDELVGKRDLSSNHFTVKTPNKPEKDIDLALQKRSDNNLICLQCCNNTDGCNRHLCGSPAATTVRCMACDDVIDTKYCDVIKECGSGQSCFVRRRYTSVSHLAFYEMGCMGQKQCEVIKHSYVQSCFTCCNSTDLCNYDVCSQKNGLGTTTVATPHTSATPTEFQLIIQGPDKGRFKSEISLACITSPPAQTYTWKFNGTSALPKGVATQSSTAGSVAGINVLSVGNLTEATLGAYTCIVSISGHTHEQTHFIDIIEETPTVTLTKTSVTTNFALQCLSTGYPIPRLEWDFIPASAGHSGVPSGVQYSYLPFMSTLFVFNYQPSNHDGSWYCKATNSVGTALGIVIIP